jgi:hypothetical protein
MEKFRVPAFYIAISGALPLYAYNVNRGVILDIGDGVTQGLFSRLHFIKLHSNTFFQSDNKLSISIILIFQHFTRVTLSLILFCLFLSLFS